MAKAPAATMNLNKNWWLIKRCSFSPPFLFTTWFRFGNTYVIARVNVINNLTMIDLNSNRVASAFYKRTISLNQMLQDPSWYVKPTVTV